MDSLVSTGHKESALTTTNSTSHEETTISKYLKRRKDRPPKVNSAQLEDDGDAVLLLAKYAEAMGSISDDFRTLIFQQVGALQGLNDKSTLLNAALALLHSSKPRNEMETMLLMEIFMLHNLLAEMARRLMLSDDAKLSDSLVNRIDKLSRALRESLTTFQRGRGQGSQQKVTVEHVHVHQGAQAIVGAVTRTGEGAE